MATLAFYDSFKTGQMDPNAAGFANFPIDFNTDTIKLSLHTSTYTPNADTHVDFADVTNEVSGTNYTSGGETITCTVTETGGTVTVDGSNATWSQSGSGFNDARYAVLYKDTGTASNSPLIGYIDFTSDKGNVDGDLTVQWNASGIFTLS